LFARLKSSRRIRQGLSRAPMASSQDIVDFMRTPAAMTGRMAGPQRTPQFQQG